MGRRVSTRGRRLKNITVRYIEVPVDGEEKEQLWADIVQMVMKYAERR